MPCYLFTFHGYGTWMPSHKCGYVHRMQGLQPRDPVIAGAYKSNQLHETAVFDDGVQRCLVESLMLVSKHIDLRVHAVATDPTHVHILISWHDQREWQQIRRSLRGGLTRQLNEHLGKRTWFAKLGSRKRVKDRKHFDYLMTRYLPSHRGHKWFENQS